MAKIYFNSDGDILLKNENNMNNLLMETEISSGLVVDLLIVGGGGSGGNNYSVSNRQAAGAGGGAGELIYLTGFTLLEKNYSILIGSGGTQSNGQDTHFDDLFLAKGGGKGGNAYPFDEITAKGQTGGSGGGSAGTLGTPYQSEKNATYFGNIGGANFPSGMRPAAGGGGGAGSQGENADYNYGGDGGSGLSFTISGSELFYAGGGGGAPWEPAYIGDPFGDVFKIGLGGSGVGGDANLGDINGGDGIRGSGGGGGLIGGNGGDGLVIVRYYGSQKATGGSISSVNGYTIHNFTSDDTLSIF